MNEEKNIKIYKNIYINKKKVCKKKHLKKAHTKEKRNHKWQKLDNSVIVIKREWTKYKL